MAFYDNGTGSKNKTAEHEVMRIDNNKVMIGDSSTINPGSNTLTVAGTTRLQSLNVGTPTFGNNKWNFGNQSALSIDGTGRISNPGSDYGGYVNVNDNLIINGIVNVNRPPCGVGCQVAKFQGTKPTVIYGDGWMGIGNLHPQYNLDVTGSGRFTGPLIASSYSVKSDIRLKDVLGRGLYGLTQILKMNPIKYKFKKENAENIKDNKTHIGFSAQAIKNVIPEAVLKDHKGYLSIDTMPIIATLVNGVKELNSMIQNWETQIKALKIENTNLKIQIDSLNSKVNDLSNRLNKLEK